MAVVTISRQYGCGGPEIGGAVAEALGARYLDRALIVEAAQRIGVPEDIVSERDERIHGVTERLLTDLAVAFSGRERTQPPTTRARGPLTDAQLLAVTRAIIREVAESGNAVILGRGAQVILKDHPNALHVHLVAPLSKRVQYVMTRRNVTAEEARNLIAREDALRADYLRTYYGADWHDPLLYHLVLNTGRLTHEAAVHTIVLLAAVKDEGRRLTALARNEADAEQLFLSMQAMRDAVRGIVDRYRR